VQGGFGEKPQVRLERRGRERTSERSDGGPEGVRAASPCNPSLSANRQPKESVAGILPLIEVDLSLPAPRVIRALEQIIEWRAKPQAICSDHSSE